MTRSRQDDALAAQRPAPRGQRQHAQCQLHHRALDRRAAQILRGQLCQWHPALGASAPDHLSQQTSGLSYYRQAGLAGAVSNSPRSTRRSRRSTRSISRSIPRAPEGVRDIEGYAFRNDRRRRRPVRSCRTAPTRRRRAHGRWPDAITTRAGHRGHRRRMAGARRPWRPARRCFRALGWARAVFDFEAARAKCGIRPRRSRHCAGAAGWSPSCRSSASAGRFRTALMPLGGAFAQYADLLARSRDRRQAALCRPC